MIDSSNWMRFVRPAMTSKEQNLEICQQNDGIVFLTTRNILPKEELKAAPNPAYAARRELPLLQPEKHKGTWFSVFQLLCFQPFSIFQKTN